MHDNRRTIQEVEKEVFRMRTLRFCLPIVAIILAACGVQPRADAAQSLAASEWVDTFSVPREELVPTGRNPFFVLEPGYRLTLEGKEGRKTVRVVISVLNDTEAVDGVTTRVVEERESMDGQLVEVSRNFFAISSRTKDVYYFGEDVDIYRDGKVTAHDGAWRSGVKGARYGLIMPGLPTVGQKYYQEYAPDTAMDRAKHVSVTEVIETPSGRFANCLKVEETTPLEPGVSIKVYAPGIGLAADNTLRLVAYGAMG